MKILFVFSISIIKLNGKPFDHPGKIYFGISSISSVLKQHGHDTELLILSKLYKDKNFKMIDDAINRFSPDLLCFSSVASEFRLVNKIAAHVKAKFPELKTMIGGVHVTLKPEEADFNIFDVCCIGEGEEPTLEYVSQISSGREPSDIKNLWLKQKNGEVQKNQLNPYIENLDELPFPDREIWEPWMEGFDELEHVVLLGKGCPFLCTYCSNHALKHVTDGKYVRMRSPQNIIDEIIEIRRKYPKIKKFYLEVETIGLKMDWTLELCKKFKEYNETLESPIEYGTNLRVIPGMDVEKLFENFRAANIKYLNIGLESGSERIRKEVLKRNYSNDDFVKTVFAAKKYGMKVYVYNLIGLPTERIEDVKETIAVNRLVQPERTITSIFFPYPGTQLFDFCKENGYLVEDFDIEVERSAAAINLPYFTPKQVNRVYTMIDYYIYKGYRNRAVLLISIVIRKIMTGKSFVIFNKLLFSDKLRRYLKYLLTGMKRK